MDEKLDYELRKMLLEALERVKQFSADMERRQEEKLWKKIEAPCNLAYALERITKENMTRISRNLELGIRSTLKKNELKEELARIIPARVGSIFVRFDDERYNLARKITDKNGYIYVENMKSSKVRYLTEQGIIYSGTKDGQKVLVMPEEIMEAFRKEDGSELKHIVRRNTEWVRLTHGLLYYYGVLDFGKLRNMIEKLTGVRPDTVEYMNVLFDIMPYYGQIRRSAGYYCDSRIFDIEKILNEQKARTELPYFPFTKEQLFRAGKAEYIDKTPALIDFLSFIRENYDINAEEADEISMQCTNIINSDAKPDVILQYLESILEFPDFEFVQQLMGKIQYLCNNTRQWILKGHTPSEVFELEEKYLKPLPASSFLSEKNVSDAIENKTRKKVGRNDPCPCGSGKKYKKCCGK